MDFEPTERPKCSLKQLRESSPDAAAVMNIIVRELLLNPNIKELAKFNLGLEATIESIEGLIDKGYVRIVMIDEGFAFQVWDVKKGEYINKF